MHSSQWACSAGRSILWVWESTTRHTKQEYAHIQGFPTRSKLYRCPHPHWRVWCLRWQVALRGACKARTELQMSVTMKCHQSDQQRTAVTLCTRESYNYYAVTDGQRHIAWEETHRHRTNLIYYIWSQGITSGREIYSYQNLHQLLVVEYTSTTGQPRLRHASISRTQNKQTEPKQYQMICSA